MMAILFGVKKVGQIYPTRIKPISSPHGHGASMVSPQGE
jgi:hypothetical protein